jgi:hypothetical protein
MFGFYGREAAMKIALNAAVALMLCALLLAGNARAQTEAGPAPGSATLPIPGIVVTPPTPPPADTQQSCPDTGNKLELIG